MTAPADLYQQYHTYYENHLRSVAAKDEALAQQLRDYKFRIFFSNPPLAVARNGLLVCGLKPYARTGQVYSFPPPTLPENYNAYLDETWSTPYVRRVLRLIEMIQTISPGIADPRRAVITQWFYQRAEDARQLKKFGLKLPDQLTFQQQVINYYQPKILLCIGNGNDYSAFAGMVALHNATVAAATTTPYLERSQLKYLRTPERLIIGVPHLSRYPVNATLETFIREII